MIHTEGVQTIANAPARTLKKKWRSRRPKPLLLDTFSGAGGASMGYSQHFDVIGSDLHPQPRYPFDFVQSDALMLLRRLLRGDSLTTESGRVVTAHDIAVIHASPPCQAYSDLQKQNKREYPDLVGPVRVLLKKLAAKYGIVYVIENVEGAPLVDPVTLCGEMFQASVPDTRTGGLRVIRHRLFESNVTLSQPEHPTKHRLTYTFDKRKKHFGKCDEWTCNVQVTGGGNSTVAAARDAMGIGWGMTKKELNEAIPPAYTRYVASQLADWVSVLPYTVREAA